MEKKQIIFLLIGLLLLGFLLLINLDGIFKILVFGLFCLFTAAAVNPKLGLFLLLIARPSLDILTARPVVQTENFSLNSASLFAVAVITFSAAILIKNFSRIKTLPLKYNWLIFFSLALASIFFSYSPYLSLAEALRLLSVPAIYGLAYFLLAGGRDLKNLIKAIIISAIMPSLFALWQYYTASGLTVPFEGIYNRIYGTFAHPNLFAYYLLLPLALSLYLFLSGNKKQLNSILYFLFATILAIILTLTFTRGAWLALLLVIAIVGIFRYRSLLAAALILAALAYFLIPPINFRVNDLISGRSDSSITWRLSLWNDAKEYIKDRPLLGYGAGVANDLILKKRGEQFGSSDPHNDYLKIAIENGLIGLLAYIVLIAGLFINLIKKYFSLGRTQLQTLVLTAIGLAVAFYIMSAADNILRNTALQWSFWALVGAILAQKNSQEKSSS